MDLLAAYSNRTDLLLKLQHTARRLEQTIHAAETDQPRSVRTTAGAFRAHQLVRRLGEAALSEIIARFEAGTPKHRLAAEYGISESSIKRLIRRRRAHARKDEESPPESK